MLPKCLIRRRCVSDSAFSELKLECEIGGEGGGLRCSKLLSQFWLEISNGQKCNRYVFNVLCSLDLKLCIYRQRSKIKIEKKFFFLVFFCFQLFGQIPNLTCHTKHYSFHNCDNARLFILFTVAIITLGIIFVFANMYLYMNL